MSDATSSFLNLPLRSESQARAAHELVELERRRRLEHHGTAFCRRVLAGAFERVYQTDGNYRLREIQSGAWLKDLPPTDLARELGPTPPLAAPLNERHPSDAPTMTDPSCPARERVTCPARGRVTSPADRIVAARHLGYASALRDLSRWISEAANSPRLDVDTLAAMNGQIAHLARQAPTLTFTGTDTGAPETPKGI